VPKVGSQNSSKRVLPAQIGPQDRVNKKARKKPKRNKDLLGFG